MNFAFGERDEIIGVLCDGGDLWVIVSPSPGRGGFFVAGAWAGWRASARDLARGRGGRSKWARLAVGLGFGGGRGHGAGARIFVDESSRLLYN